MSILDLGKDGIVEDMKSSNDACILSDLKFGVHEIRRAN